MILQKNNQMPTINKFRQKFCHSCLVTSLLMISGAKDQSQEEKIFFEGEKRDYDYYINSTLASFAKNTGKQLEVLVDNKYFTETLSHDLNELSEKVHISFKPVTTPLIKEIVKNQPLVVHLDDNFLGDYSHASHFVVVHSIRKDGRFEIFNPINGKSKYLTERNLGDAILSLKKHIKMCPILITVK